MRAKLWILLSGHPSFPGLLVQITLTCCHTEVVLMVISFLLTSAVFNKISVPILQCDLHNFKSGLTKHLYNRTISFSVFLFIKPNIPFTSKAVIPQWSETWNYNSLMILALSLIVIPISTSPILYISFGFLWRTCGHLHSPKMNMICYFSD